MYYVGIDLGGTNIKAGIVDGTGKILSQAYAKTLATRPYQDIVRDMAGCVMQAANNAKLTIDDLASIGIGIPGYADRDGNVVFCTNLGWHNIPLKEEMQKYINLPVAIDNDATVAGYAESISGVSKDAKSSVFITLGTGVGGAIVINGRPWSGAHGIGSEIGHMILNMNGVPCNCGNNGSMEKYTSATAIIRMARQACVTYQDSLMLRRAEGDLDRINAKTVIDAAKAGDRAAVEVFDEYCKFLAMSIHNIITFLDPDMVVLGGGVSHAGDFLLNRVREKVPRYLLYKTLPYSQICLAKLGNEAGTIGAAMIGKLALEDSVMGS